MCLVNTCFLEIPIAHLAPRKFSGFELSKDLTEITPFDMGGGHPKNVFHHCAQMLKRRKLKLGDI